MKWPHDIFKAAFLAKGSPICGSKEADLMVLVEEERWQRVNQGHREALYERFPDLHDLEGRLAALTMRTRVLSNSERSRDRKRWIVRAEVEDSPKKWFHTLIKLRNMMLEGGRGRTNIYPPGQDKRGQRTRQMVEFIFRGSGIKCVIFINQDHIDGAGENFPRVKGVNTQGGKGCKTDALIISKAGKPTWRLSRDSKK